jgi:RHS repeat-associated protein
VQAYQGDDNLDINFKLWWNETIRSQDNEPIRQKVHASSSYNLKYALKPNGYECCNRKDLGMDSIPPKITIHANDATELYYQDIDEAYIYGAEFIEEKLDDFNPFGNDMATFNAYLTDNSTRELIQLQMPGDNILVYSISTDSGRKTASFEWEVDLAGNIISDAYCPGEQLTSITSAGVTRSFEYHTSGNLEGKLKSYKDSVGALEREYIIDYDPVTFEVSGVLGGDGSGNSCSSCNSGDRRLYLYTDSGYVYQEKDLADNVIYTHAYDDENRLTDTWLGSGVSIPVKHIDYSIDANGNKVRTIYDYTTDINHYRLTLEIEKSDHTKKTVIEFTDPENVDILQIPDDLTDTIIANGYYEYQDGANTVTVEFYPTIYEYEYNNDVLVATIEKSPEFNTRALNETGTYRRTELHGSSDGYDIEKIIEVASDGTEIEVCIGKTYYNSDQQAEEIFSWYNLRDSSDNYSYYPGTYYTYGSNGIYEGRLMTVYSDSTYAGNVMKQLNGQDVLLQRDYTYYPDGRIETETVSNNGTDEVITSYGYDGYNQSTGITVTDSLDNVLYTTISKSTALGDVIYTIDKRGVSRGKEYDDGGKVISEFVFADPSDVNGFDGASNADIETVYTGIDVLIQKLYYYDSAGRIEFILEAVQDGSFSYYSHCGTFYDFLASNAVATSVQNDEYLLDGWRVTQYEYDLYGRKKKDISGPVLVYETTPGVYKYYYTGDNIQTDYVYNNQGELEMTIYPDGHWVKQIRNGLGQIVKIEEGYTDSTPADVVLTCSETEYDANGRVFRTWKGIGSERVATASYSYDDYNNKYRHYLGDVDAVCDYVEYKKNYAGDVEREIYVDVEGSVGSTTETIVKDVRYKYNSRGEKYEEILLDDPNDVVSDTLRDPDEYDRIKLFSYDYQGRLVETLTKADNNSSIYGTATHPVIYGETVSVVVYQSGDRVEQNWYNLTGELEYSDKFEYAGDIATTDTNELPFADVDEMLDYALDVEGIYITKRNYADGQLTSTEVLSDYTRDGSGNALSAVWLTTAGYSYDNAGRTWKAYDADYDMEYTLQGDSTVYTHTYNNYTETLYNSLNQPVAQTLWQVKPTLRINELLELTSAPGENPIAVSRVLTSYNNRGQKERVVVFIDPSGHSDSAPLEFDDIVIGTDKVTDYCYDQHGRLEFTKELTYQFTALGMTTTKSAYTQNLYDEIGRVWQTESGNEEEYFSIAATYSVTPYKTIEYEYNALGQREYQTITDIDPADDDNTVIVTNRYEYINQGQLETVETYDGSNYDYTQIYSYDVLGRRTSYQDADGLTTYFTYYYTGELAEKTENPGAIDLTLKRTTSYGYDRFGRQKSITSKGKDSYGNDDIKTTSYEYSYLDKITNVTYQIYVNATETYLTTKTLEYIHDMRGGVIECIEDADGNTATTTDIKYTHYKRDEMGRVVGKAYGQTVDWTEMGISGWFDQIVYNALGLKDKVTKFDGSSDSIFYYYVYDGLGNLTQSVENCGDFDGVTIDYGYDCRGNLAWITYPNERTVEYNRSQYGSIDDITYNGLDIISYDYIGSRIAAKTFGNGIEYSVLFDGVGRITDEDYSRGSTVVASADYSYTSESPDSRLASRDGAAYSYDNLGKLTGEASSSYTSDYLGNPTNAASDGLFYGVDAESRVVDVDDSSGDIADYAYDMLGRRIKKTVGSLTTWFVYDKMGNVISEYEQIGTGSINWARDYVYGVSGEAVYMQMPPQSYTTVYEWFVDFADAWLCYPDCTSNELTAWDTNNDDEIDSDDLIEWVPVIADEVFYSQRSYLLTDYKGSVIAKTNDEGGIDEIAYDAWGQASVAQGVDHQGLSILWNGYYFDYETGNYYLRNRYYSPVERCFLTNDPRGVNPDNNWENPFMPLWQYTDGYSTTVYCKSDPVNYFDPSGLISELKPDPEGKPSESLCKKVRRIMGLVTLPGTTNQKLWRHYIEGNGKTLMLNMQDFHSSETLKQEIIDEVKAEYLDIVVNTLKNSPCNSEQNVVSGNQKSRQSSETVTPYFDAMINVWTLNAIFHIDVSKKCRNNCCLNQQANVSYRFHAKDVTDFNPGDMFMIPPLYIIYDDLINQCKIGKKFNVFAVEWEKEKWDIPCP